MNINEILGTLENVKETVAGYTAKCPAHNDGQNSLSISTGNEDKILLNCFAGCSTDEICNSLNIKVNDLFTVKKKSAKKYSNEVEAIYNYTDWKDDIIHRVIRYKGKRFTQQQPNERGGWINNMQGVEKILYNESAVLIAITNNEIIYLVAGEKDANAMIKAELVATTNAGGEAAKWLPQYVETLTGANIVIICDKDATGYRHGHEVAKSMQGKAKSVKVIELPDINGVKVKDSYDYIEAGGDVDAIKDIEALPDEPDKPQDATKPITSILWGISQQKGSAGDIRSEIVQAVLDFLNHRGKFYFITDQREFASVMYFDSKRKLLLRIQSDDFIAWLSDTIAVNRSDNTFKYILSACETFGLSTKSTGIIPSVYWSAKDNVYYLSNGPGHMAKITKNGVKMVDNGTDGVLFASNATLEPWILTTPQDPFKACSIFNDLSAETEHARTLLKLWVCSIPTNHRTKPPLCIVGTVGSGKTRVIVSIYELFGMPSRISAINKNGESDFWVSLDAGGVSCFDNADTRIDWLPDALAAAATGGVHSKRKLYKDNDIVVLKPAAWITITSSNPSFASDPGLADRLEVIRLKRRTGSTSESALSDEVKTARNAGLSWLCEILSKVLADTEPVQKGLNARHPDWATVAVKLGRAMNCEREAIQAIQAAEADKSILNIETDFVGSILLDVLKIQSFHGTASELLEVMENVNSGLSEKLSVKRLSKRLSKLWPHLESVFNAKKEKDGHSRKQIFTFQEFDFAHIAHIEPPISTKPPMKENNSTLLKSASEYTQSTQAEIDFDEKQPKNDENSDYPKNWDEETF